MGDAVGDEIGNVLIGQRIEHVLARPAGLHQPLGFEQSEPLRDGRQAVAAPLRQFADADFAVGQQQEGFQSRDIPQGAKDVCRIFQRPVRNRLHPPSTVVLVPFTHHFVSHRRLVK